LVATLQGPHGVGVRPYREPAGGDTHARESHSLHANSPAIGDRSASRDLRRRIRGRAVGRRCSGRRGRRRAVRATTAPQADGLKGTGLNVRSLPVKELQPAPAILNVGASLVGARAPAPGLVHLSLASMRSRPTLPLPKTG
jgi:hypothetical protein